MSEVTEGKTESAYCVECSIQGYSLRELSALANFVMMCIKAQAGSQLLGTKFRTMTVDSYTQLPDDVEFRIRGEDLNLLGSVVRDIRTLVEVN